MPGFTSVFSQHSLVTDILPIASSGPSLPFPEETSQAEFDELPLVEVCIFNFWGLIPPQLLVSCSQIRLAAARPVEERLEWSIKLMLYPSNVNRFSAGRSSGAVYGLFVSLNLTVSLINNEVVVRQGHPNSSLVKMVCIRKLKLWWCYPKVCLLNCRATQQPPFGQAIIQILPTRLLTPSLTMQSRSFVQSIPFWWIYILLSFSSTGGFWYPLGLEVWMKSCCLHRWFGDRVQHLQNPA